MSLTAITQNPLFVPQLFGVAAMVFMIAANGFKNDKHVNQMWFLSNTLWVVHYTMMGSMSGALACFVHVLRVIGSLYIHPTHRIKTFWGLVVLYTVAVFPFIHSPTDVLPMLASYLMCVAFYLMRGLHTKYFIFLSLSFWLAYGIVVQSIGNMTGMVLSLILLTHTIWRMKKEARMAITTVPPETSSVH